MSLDNLFEQVKNAVLGHSAANSNSDADGLLGQLSGLFGQHREQYGANPSGDYYRQQPDDRFGNVRSSNDDPLGDPGAQDQNAFRNVRSSNDDPLGDPGEQDTRRRW